MLEEHSHVDAVGREADEEEDRDEDGGLDSVNEELRLKTDEVVGVVPRMVVFMARMMQFSGTLLADWLTLSTVHGDVISVSLTVVSDSTIIKGVIIDGVCTAAPFYNVYRCFL